MVSLGELTVVVVRCCHRENGLSFDKTENNVSKNHLGAGLFVCTCLVSLLACDAVN